MEYFVAIGKIEGEPGLNPNSKIDLIFRYILFSRY